MAQINKPTDYFNTVLWTGDGTSPRTITGVGFNPDFIWGRRRDDAAGHNLYDRIRGAGVSTNLQSNGTGAEGGGSPGTFGYLSSFETDGFGVTAGSTDNAYWNNNTATYVGWNWLADNTTGSSNTDGSITSTVSANTTSGFSIVSYTGTGSVGTVGHGLNSEAKMIIVKDRDAAANWNTYHVSVGNAKTVQLNLTNAESATSSWNSTTPTSSVFSLGAVSAVNTSSNNYIAYCFAEKKGFSKFGKYTGNGSTDGTFVYTGFRPAFVIGKITSDLNEWFMMDSTRSTFNVANKSVYANTSGAENTNHNVDFLSNGFKLRDSDGTVNLNNGSYIYMAFAENPLVGTNNIPATAR